MDFFYSQESLTAVQWILRAVISFFFLLIVTKIMGQRSLSQLRLLDFIMALSIGNIIAHPLSDQHLGMKGSMITIVVLVILYLILVFLSLKWLRFTKFVDPSPFPLIRNGKILYKGLTKARIPIDVLLTELRKKQIHDIQQVALALWESDGTISFFLESQYQTLTPKDMKLMTKSFSFPITIIKDGKIDFEELKQTGKDEDWLKTHIRTVHSLDIKSILLATMDDQNGKINVFLYK
ncbi:YetF domain-containing protein [Priestia megaterium]